MRQASQPDREDLYAFLETSCRYTGPRPVRPVSSSLTVRWLNA